MNICSLPAFPPFPAPMARSLLTSCLENRRFFLLLSVVAVWGLGITVRVAAVEQPPAAGSRPNVIFLLLDDAGWTDTGSFGGRMVTPHLDRLGAEGMRFSDAHSPAPNCSPSRAGILTGRIPARTGIYSYLPEGHPMHLRAEEVTVAELARQAGYRTGHFGKWHLSDLDDDSQPGPLDQGFEYSLATSNNAAPSHRDPVNFRRNGERVGKLEGYSCQIVVDETLALRDGDWAILARTDDADRPKAHPLLREDMARVLESKPVSWELYHLGRDRGQTRVLSADQPQRLETMKRQLAELHAKVLAEGVSWDIPETYRAGTARRVWNS